jgi:hypothetical protein
MDALLNLGIFFPKQNTTTGSVSTSSSVISPINLL